MPLARFSVCSAPAPQCALDAVPTPPLNRCQTPLDQRASCGLGSAFKLLRASQVSWRSRRTLRRVSPRDACFWDPQTLWRFGPCPAQLLLLGKRALGSAAGRWVTPVTVVVCGRKQTVWWGSGVQVEASATGRRGSRAAGQAGRRADTRAVAPAGSVRALPPRRVTARGLLAVSALGTMASPAAHAARAAASAASPRGSAPQNSALRTRPVLPIQQVLDWGHQVTFLTVVPGGGDAATPGPH